MTVVVVLELGGWDQADLAVQAPVVEPVDVLGDGDLEVVDVLPGALVADQLGLEQRVERLGQGVVVRIAGGADRGDGAGLGEALGVADGDVLDALVAVVRQAGDVVPGVLRVQIPISSASRARSVRRLVDSCQPTTRRLNTSTTNAA